MNGHAHAAQLHFFCPHCGQCIHTAVAAERHHGHCPGCHARVEIPFVTAPDAIPASPAPAVPAPLVKARGTHTIPPASERQKEYARSLGAVVDDAVDCRQISELITAAEQKKYADLDHRDEAARQDLLAELTAGQMANALLARDGESVIVIRFEKAAMDKAGNKVESSIAFSDDLTEHDMRRAVLFLASSIYRQTHGEELEYK